MRKDNKKSLIKNIIIFLILFAIICVAYQFYQKKNFNDFMKYETNLHTSDFSRDNQIKYNNNRSYKIESQEYNDAMFSKKIQLKKRTPYRVTCMVKTRNIEAKENKSGVGAQISIQGTTEMSESIVGTNDWQKIELIFNSKNRDSAEIGFRLGGNFGDAKGEAWFADLKLEEGTADESSNWKFACVIFKNTEININNNPTKISVTREDISDIKNTIKRFENCCSQLSGGKMTAECDAYETETPITELSYDEKFGYYVSAENIQQQIKNVLSKGDYDHIFAIVKLGNEEHQNEIEINDWIGLGSMDYHGIGFSNIRLPNNSKSYIYKYNIRINQFPEEVFLHEFLHTLERNAEEYGYERPQLHDYEKYGYEDEALIGQKTWYADYMNKNINTTSGKIGLPNEIYTIKPAKNSSFKYPYIIDEFKEPQNIIEEIQELLRNISKNLK